MSNTVMCNLCRFEANRRCVRKNNKVKVNKHRHCELYEESADKLEMILAKKERNIYPEVTTRPDEIFDGKNMRRWDGTKYKKIKEADNIDKLKSASEVTGSVSEKPFSGDPKHPLTGDLSRFFKSTVSDE